MADEPTTQEEIKPEEITEETVPAEETTPEAPEEQPEEEAAPEAKAEEKPKPKTAKLSKKLEDLASEIEKLSVLELSDLVKALEERLGVSAAPMMAAPAGAATSATGAASAEPAEEQTTFNVILANTGANKIGVIKTVREINQTLGLKEAKDLVESAPKEILSGVNKATAQEAKQKLEAAGAQVELK